jgi:hypothetical protein
MNAPDVSFSSSCLALAAASLAMLAPMAAAQSSETFVANDSYLSDYEVGSWSDEDRSRGSDYLQQQYMASDQLLGGPVPKPGEPTFSDTYEPAGYGTARSGLNAGADDRLNLSQTMDDPTRAAPGMPVVTQAGATMGAVAIVQKDEDGNMQALWIRRSKPDSSDLVDVTKQVSDVRKGRVIVSTES